MKEQGAIYWVTSIEKIEKNRKIERKVDRKEWQLGVAERPDAL